MLILTHILAFGLGIGLGAYIFVRIATENTPVEPEKQQVFKEHRCKSNDKTDCTCGNVRQSPPSDDECKHAMNPETCPDCEIELVSECCTAKIEEGTDICSDCKEHTGIHNN